MPIYCKVLVQITKYADGTDNPEGHISAILGHKNDPGVDILSIIYQHGIEIEFPDNVLNHDVLRFQKAQFHQEHLQLL
jgi:exoribonuclease R